MGTRSNIGLEEPDGTILFVYCHYDGYLAQNGAMLVAQYSDETKIRELLCLGDVRSLDTTLDETSFFGRDLGEERTDRVYVNSREAMLREEYNYLWSVLDQAWYVHREPGDAWPRLDSMLEVIKSLENDTQGRFK